MKTTSITTTKWLVIRDGRTPGVYSVRSRHKTKDAAIKRWRVMARNCAEGHVAVIPENDRAKYGI